MKKYFGEMKESRSFVFSDVLNFIGYEFNSHNFIQDKEGQVPQGYPTKVNVAVFLAPPCSYFTKTATI